VEQQGQPAPLSSSPAEARGSPWPSWGLSHGYKLTPGQPAENAATAGGSKSTPVPLRAPFRAIKSAKSSHKTPKCQWISGPAVSRGHGIYFNKMCISRGHATNNLRLLECTKVCTDVAGECKPKQAKTKQSKTIHTGAARSHTY